MSERTYGLCPECFYSATPDEILGESRKHFTAHSLRCVRCGFTTETKSTWAGAKSEWNKPRGLSADEPLGEGVNSIEQLIAEKVA